MHSTMPIETLETASNHKKLLLTSSSTPFSNKSHQLKQFQSISTPNVSTCKKTQQNQQHLKKEAKFFPIKIKFISKQSKESCLKKAKFRKNRQEKVFRTLTKRIHPFANESNHENLDTIRAYDWVMEVCSMINMSRNGYYMVISMAECAFLKDIKINMKQNSFQSLLASMISLAGKFQSGRLNYPLTLSQICYTNKSQIIAGQTQIMAFLNFKIPILHINQTITEILTNWHKFITKNKNNIKICSQILLIGQSSNPVTWPSICQNNFLSIIKIFDILMIKFYRYFSIRQHKSIIQCLTISMFIWFNYECKQFFPVHHNDETYLASLFRIFLAEVYSFQMTKFMRWMKLLIKIKNDMNIIENVHKNFGNKTSLTRRQATQNSNIYNTRNIIIENFLQNSAFYCQNYHPISLWKY